MLAAMIRSVVAALVVLAGCSHKEAASGPAPKDEAGASGVAVGAWIAELKAQRTADPGDLGAAYLAAYVAGMAGDGAEALAILEMLADGWPFPVQASDFIKLAGEPRFAAVLERTAGCEPAGTATTAFTLGPADLVPEGIACDAASGAVYVGSIVHRKIVRVDGTAAGDLVPEAQGGLGGVLGMTVDASRRLLWAAHNPLGEATRAAGKERSGVAAFDLDTGATKVDVKLEGAHLLNDVALAGADVYVSDSTRGAVWRLRGGQGALERVAADGTFVCALTPSRSSTCAAVR